MARAGMNGCKRHHRLRDPLAHIVLDGIMLRGEPLQGG
jgi:hypothetical protein